MSTNNSDHSNASRATSLYTTFRIVCVVEGILFLINSWSSNAIAMAHAVVLVGGLIALAIVGRR